MAEIIETTLRSLVLRNHENIWRGINWLAALVLAVLLGLLMTTSSFASGEGHSHEPAPEQISEEPVHDNNDGHNDAAPVEPTHDNADGHHDVAPMESMEPAHDNADGHHEETAMEGHHDEMAEAGGHDHSAHEEGTWADTKLERLYAWAGKFHPAATNFPIALLLAAALAELLFLLGGNPAMRNATRFCLWTGALSAALTVALGWGFVGFDLANDDQVLSAHRWNGTAIAALALVTLWLGERSFKPRGSPGAFRVSLLLVAAMVAYNGYLGGKMVYGADHYAWPIG